MGPNIYSKEYLKRKLDKIPDDIYNDSLNTTWNENVDEKLQKALADIRTNVSNEDYNKTKKEFDYEEYSKERWDYVKSLADSNMKDDIDNNALLEIETSYLTQQSYKISKCMQDKWEEICNTCYNSLEQYNISLKYYNKIKDNVKKTNVNKEQLLYDISKNAIITNERKVWYENNELIYITSISNIMQVIYYIILIILIFVLIYKKVWKDKINIIIVIFFFIWPSISGFITNNIIKFIRYINTLFPNYAYTNLN